MQVIPWSKKRRMLLKGLATLDANVGNRAAGTLHAWESAKETPDPGTIAHHTPDDYLPPPAIGEDDPAETLLLRPTAPEPAEPPVPDIEPAPAPAIPKSKPLSSYLDD